MTNEEKLQHIKAKFTNYISGIETLAQFKTFLNNITKAKIVTGLKDAIQEEIDTRNKYMTGKQAEVDNLVSFKNEIDQL